MAIIWAESFDLYGTSLAALTLRGYNLINASGGTTLGNNSSVARTGTGYLQFANTASNDGLLKIFDTPLTTFGVGCAINCYNISADDPQNPGLTFVGSGPNYIALVMNFNASFGINVYQNNTLRGSSANNIWTLGTYYWYEVKITVSTGTIEVKQNGETILLINGLTLPANFVGTSIGKYNLAGGGNAFCRWDDWVIWDTTGTRNNDFLGDRRCVTQYPDSDTVEADWTPSSGTGFSCIDEATPSDADYIQANNPGDISEFGKQAIGISTNDIAAAVVIARALKTDAGASSFRVGINSNANVVNSAEMNLNTTVAYYSGIFEENPDGNVAWTKSALDAANIRFTREL